MPQRVTKKKIESFTEAYLKIRRRQELNGGAVWITPNDIRKELDLNVDLFNEVYKHMLKEDYFWESKGYESVGVHRSEQRG